MSQNANVHDWRLQILRIPIYCLQTVMRSKTEYWHFPICLSTLSLGLSERSAASAKACETMQKSQLSSGNNLQTTFRVVDFRENNTT
jgi:hypothetical protein